MRGRLKLAVVMFTWVISGAAASSSAEEQEGVMLPPAVSAPALIPLCSWRMTSRHAVVITRDSRTLEGSVQCLDDRTLVIQTTTRDVLGLNVRRIVTEPLSNVRRIVEPADGVGDGALKGLALGALGVLGGGGDQCLPFGNAGTCAAALIAQGAALGAVIDWAHSRRNVLYVAPSIKPPVAGAP